MPIETKDAYDEAVRQLQAASAAYYLGDDPLMADASYDRLWREVSEAEDAHPQWWGDGPAEFRATAPVTSLVAGGAVGGDVPHSRPMLSLDNVFSAEELAAWLDRVTGQAPGAEFVVEPKLDGLALNLTYRDGHLVQVTTRGDGLAGEDVTFCGHLISNVPAARATWLGGQPFTAEVRGEAIFTHDQFERANQLREENGHKPFSNARNGVAGTVRGAKDRSYGIPFSFVAYDMVVPDGTVCLNAGRPYPTDHYTHLDWMAQLGRVGFSTALSVEDDSVLSAAGVPAAVAAWEEHRYDLAFDTDGCVVKVVKNEDRDQLGMTGRAPRWAIAYKFPPDQVTSTLREVLWQVGKTGVITPRAVIDPCEVGGVTITYASLHNPGDMARKGFMLGDTVLVHRAGEVIPRLEAPVVAARTGAEQPIVPPQACPQCGGPIDRSQERWRCERGRECGLAEAMTYAVGRDALDIDGLGRVQVTNLVAAERLTGVDDLFFLTEETLVAAGKVAPANAPKIIAQIEQARSAAPARVITALSIRGTGRSLSRALARTFGTLSGVFAATEEELAGVDKIGPIKAALIRDQLAELTDVVEQLIALGIGEIPEGQAAGGSTGAEPAGLPLAGKTVVVTGSMVGRLAGKSRNEVNELIENLGGKSSGSVSRNTSLLVVGQNAGSKLAKATELGVQVMTEEEFAGLAGITA